MAKTWYPVVDRAQCERCGTCVSFCTHGVYDTDDDGYPLVVNPDNCVEFCQGCAKICPAGAISYAGASAS
ncbi:MAG TPA: 4Fe-4S ferredoxin [Chloroflexi bacterium]|nr:4Fe-4S ferredoxin [Chloroflexota bacterium]